MKQKPGTKENEKFVVSLFSRSRAIYNEILLDLCGVVVVAAVSSIGIHSSNKQQRRY